MSNAADAFLTHLKAAQPSLNAEVREYSGSNVWIDVSSPDLETWWEVEIRDGQEYLIYCHYPNDPEDAAFGPADDRFASARATALYLKAASTIRARNPQTLGPFMIAARKGERDRFYAFSSRDDAAEFAGHLIREGIAADNVFFFRQEPAESIPV